MKTFMRLNFWRWMRVMPISDKRKIVLRIGRLSAL
jgi:hypothetical protein